MRYAIISDIHANLEALTACLAQIDALGVDRVICLGDTVNFGGDPAACLELLQARGIETTAGAHDWFVSGRLHRTLLCPGMREATEWTAGKLSPAQRTWLDTRPLLMHTGEFAAVHATFNRPEDFNHIQLISDVASSFAALWGLGKRLGFLGNSHKPVAFYATDPFSYSLDQSIATGGEDDEAVMVNVGSVGQPRDEDPRACFAVFDSLRQRVDFERVTYDIDTAAEKIRQAGRLSIHAQRLYEGR